MVRPSGLEHLAAMAHVEQTAWQTRAAPRSRLHEALGDECVVVALPVLPLVGLTLLLLRPAGCGALVGMDAAKAVDQPALAQQTC